MNALVRVNEHSQVEVVKYINDDQADKILISISELYKYEKFDLSLKSCLLNSLDLSKYCQDLDKIEMQELVYPDDAFLKYKVSTLIGNFISSYYNFLAFCESNSKKWFGVEGYEKTKKIISSYYDNYYLYKFYYKFRNYITHKGLPIHSVFLTGKKITIVLLSEKLLDEFDAWGQDLKEELKKSSGHLDLNTLFSNCNILVAKLAKELHDFYLEQISSHKTFVLSLIKEKFKNRHSYKLFVSSSLTMVEDIKEAINSDLQIFDIPLVVFADV